MSDPFATLGIDPRFDLDEADLRSRYLAAAAATHPDRFTDPLEQTEAADRASLLNDAYRTLLDPERRANALLIVLGGLAKEDDNTLPPDLLMDMMQVRERLEDATANTDVAELSKLRTWADQQRQTHLDRVAALFAANPPDLKQVRIELNALRYIERMIEQMPEG